MKYQNKLNTSNLNNKKQTLFKRLFGCKNIVILPVLTCKEIISISAGTLNSVMTITTGYPTEQKIGFLGYTLPNKKKNCIIEKI